MMNYKIKNTSPRWNHAIAHAALCLFFSVSFVQNGQSQCPQNIGFELGNFNNWNAFTGSCCPFSLWVPGLVAGRHTIMTGPGLDAQVGAQIPVVAPGGGNYSVRLGNSNVGSESERLVTSIPITNLNTSYIYWYAVVLEDPAHNPADQPRFEIEILDQNGNLVPCGHYLVVAGAGIPGFLSLGTLKYKKWSPVNQDLSAYVGTTISVTFSTGDCALSGHFGYAYIDGLCEQFNLVGGICPGDTFMTLAAPGGFLHYQWTIGGTLGDTTQITQIGNPTTGIAIQVALTPYAGAGCVSTLQDTINVTTAQIAADFEWPQNFCLSDTIQFIDSTLAASSNGLLTGWQWNFGDPSTGPLNVDTVQNPYHKFSAPGFYNVTLIVETAFGCSDTIVKIIPVSPPAISSVSIASNFNGQHVSCNGANDGLINLSVVGAGPFTYQWSGPGGFSTTLEDPTGVGVGTYTVIIADTNSCLAFDTITVIEPTAVTASATGTDVICFGGTSGTASAVGGGGTPAYNFSWSPSSQSGANVSNLNANTHTVTVTDMNGCTATASVLLTQPPAITSSLAQSPVSCFGGNDGSATVSNIAGGVGNFTLSWNSFPVQTDTFANNLPAGPVTITVMDSNGCIHQNTIVVQQPQLLTVNLIPTDALCFQTATGFVISNTFGGNPPYTYLWSTNATSQNITGLMVGTYSLTVTDSKGCIASAGTTVQEPLELVTTTWQVKPEDCNPTGSGGQAASSPSGGVPPYSFIWSPTGQTTALASNLSAGNYNVFITDANGCTVLDAVTITKQASPTVFAGANKSFCEGEGGVMIDATASGGLPPYYFVWWCDSSQTWCGLDSVYDNDPIANPGLTTTYYVLAVDQNGCSSQVDSLIVTVLPKPIVNAGPDMYICSDSAPGAILQATISGAPGPFIYTWTPSTGLNNPNILNPYARPDTTTIYTLVVESLGNGCKSDATTTDTLATVTVHVMPLPVSIAHLPGPVVEICLNDSIELQGFGTDAGPLYQYQWSPVTGLSDPGIANPYAKPIVTTEFVLTVWSNGCPSYGDTVTVVVHTLPTVDAGPAVEICPGEIGQLDGEAWGDPTSGAYSFFWWPVNDIVSPNTDEDPLVSPSVTTTYYVMATTTWGCESAVDSTTLFIKPTPTAYAGENLVVCFGEQINLPGGVIPPNDPNYDPNQVFYSWTPATGLSNPNIANPAVSPTQATIYLLTITYNTCESTDELLVSVMPEILAFADADTQTICGGDSVQLYGWGGVSSPNYTWIGGGVSNPAGSEPMASPATSTVYQLVVEEGGCDDTTTIAINVIPTPTIAALSSDLRGCVDFDVSFLETTADAFAWIWDFGDGTPLSNEQNPTHTFTDPGVYYVHLTAVGQGNCQAVDHIATVTVVDVALADYLSLPLYPVRASLPNSTIHFTDNSVNATGWVWDFGDGNSSDQQHPVHTFNTPGEYMVTLWVTNEEGCVNEIIHGPYIILAPELFIPNVFTPNGDGTNDRFLVQYTGDQPFSVNITDRWGVTHYTSKNKYLGWDGRDDQGKDLNEGVYYYNVMIGDKNFAGNVTLMR